MGALKTITVNGSTYTLSGIEKGYYYNESFYKESSHTTLITPNVDRLYIDITEGNDNQQYIYNGTAYVTTGGSGGGTWGSITGDLEDQEDLKEALDGKSNFEVVASTEPTSPFATLKPSDIIDNVTSTDATKVLSAKQGKLLNDTKEATTNKVTSLSSSSTDTQYPSAKCVYDLVGNVESLLAAL